MCLLPTYFGRPLSNACSIEPIYFCLHLLYNLQHLKYHLFIYNLGRLAGYFALTLRLPEASMRQLFTLTTSTLTCDILIGLYWQFKLAMRDLVVDKRTNQYGFRWASRSIVYTILKPDAHSVTE